MTSTQGGFLPSVPSGLLSASPAFCFELCCKKKTRVMPFFLFLLLQGEFNLTNTQDGFLATAFLVGLLVASPVFSESCKHYSAFRLIGIGMGTWMLATFGCGLAVGFWSLILCRMLVGVGEASFVALAAPFIGERPLVFCLELGSLFMYLGLSLALCLWSMHLSIIHVERLPTKC